MTAAALSLHAIIDSNGGFIHDDDDDEANHHSLSIFNIANEYMIDNYIFGLPSTCEASPSNLSALNSTF